MIVLVIQSSFVSNSNAASCGPNSDCSIFLQTCSSDLCICDVGNNWQNPTQMQTIRRAQASVADNIGNVFVFGDYVSLFGLTNTAEKYLTSSNSWSYINPLPNPLANINGVFINDKIYIPGDINNPNLYIYTVSTGSWDIPLINKQSNGITNLDGRWGYQLCNIANNIYMIGGIINGGTYTNQLWVLDVTTDIDVTNGIAKWSQLTLMSLCRFGFASAVILGKSRWLVVNMTVV